MIRFCEERVAAAPGWRAGGAQLPALLHRLRDFATRLVDVHRGHRLRGAGQQGQRDRPGAGIHGQRRPAGPAATAGRGGRRPGRATLGDARRGRAPLRRAVDARGRAGPRAAGTVAVRPARLARRHWYRVLHSGPGRADGRDRAARPARQREHAVRAGGLGDQDRRPGAGRDPGGRGRVGRGSGRGCGVIRRQRAGAQPAPPAGRRAPAVRRGPRHAAARPLDPVGRRGRGLG